MCVYIYIYIYMYIYIYIYTHTHSPGPGVEEPDPHLAPQAVHAGRRGAAQVVADAVLTICTVMTDIIGSIMDSIIY